jgi:hypothetical protein
LRLHQPGMPVESLSLLATVVAAEAPEAATQYTLERTLSVRRPAVESVFVYVPPGTQALHVTAAKQSPEKITVWFFPPDTDHIIPNAITLTNGIAHKAVQEPAPGVWELLIYNRYVLRDVGQAQLEPRPDPLTPTAVDLEVKLVRAGQQISPAGTVSVANSGAPMSGKVLWSHLGSELEQPVTLQVNDRQMFRLTVPKGTRLLKAQLDSLDDAAAEVTVLAYEVKDGQAIERLKVRSMAGIGPVLRINDPAPGEWRFVLEPNRLSSGQAHAVYRDLLVHEAYGQLKTEQEAFELDSMGRWQTPLAAQPAALPIAPRHQVGVVSLGLEVPQKPGTDAPAAEALMELIDRTGSAVRD